MVRRLLEIALPRIIGFVVHAREKLTEKEAGAQKIILERMTVVPRKTAKPVVVALVGLVGSGKSTVAKKLAERIGGTVVNGDDIRIELRKLGAQFERTRAIAENLAAYVIAEGGNPVLDSDFVDANKRASLREKIREIGAELAFIRVYCDWDVAIAIDAITLSKLVDVVVLVSGDGDYEPLVDFLKFNGTIVEVAGFKRSTSSKLIEVANNFTDLEEVKDKILLK